MESEVLLGVLFIPEDDVASLNQGRHDIARFFAELPQIFAVVQIGGDGCTQTVGGPGWLRGRRLPHPAKWRRDARPVKPLGIFEKLLPNRPCPPRVNGG